MANNHLIRSSDSPFVNSVTKTNATSDGEDIILPDGQWDLMIIKRDGQQSVFLLNSPAQTALAAPYSAGQEALVISFEPGSFIDTGALLDKKTMHQLPVIDNRAFWLGSNALKIPRFENADEFAQALVRRGILKSDEVIRSLVKGEHRAQADRTLQRHFKHITGMTPGSYKQIMRALRAAEMLRAGVPALRVAHDLGYSDQFHLSKSLKKIIGQTPSEIRSEST